MIKRVRASVWSALMLAALASPAGTGAASCASPHLQATTLISGSLAGMAGAPIGVMGGVDAQHDVVWSEQGGPPEDGRLFIYNGITRRVTQFTSAYFAHGQGIGALGISPRWLVFSTFPDRFTGNDWRIVAHDRLTGREHLITTEAIGGLFSTPLALDGNTLIWAQAHPHGGADLRAEQLGTGRVRTLASASTGIYFWVAANGGHVVWEWVHSAATHGAPGGKVYFVNDVFLTAEAGGPVTALTTNGQGAEPTIDWPRVAYIAHAHFGPAGPLIVLDMHTHQHWRLALNRDDDKPRLGDGLVVYSAQGLPAFYSLVTKRQVVVSVRGEGTYLGPFYPVGRSLFSLVNNDARTIYNLAIFETHHRDPLQDLLTCPTHP